MKKKSLIRLLRKLANFVQVQGARVSRSAVYMRVNEHSRNECNEEIEQKRRFPKKSVIAHRGASGYLPEHTLPAVAMAHAMGTDYIEADLVLTQEGVPIVLHDLTLEATTNVAECFPTMARGDGHWYAIDFTLAQIKTLSAHERVDKHKKSVYPTRFPQGKSHFGIPTFTEWLELIQGLNQSTGRTVGIYPELKAPDFHEKAGYHFAEIVFSILEHYGYGAETDPVFIQCFDPDYLKYCRERLNSKLSFIQLIAPNTWQESAADYDFLQTDAGLAKISTYAQGIGVWINQLTRTLIRAAHHNHLLVHAYTLRIDDLPPGTQHFNELVKKLFGWGVDGFFTDFPDKIKTTIAELNLHSFRP